MINIIVGNSNQFTAQLDVSPNQFYKAAFSYKQNQFKFYIDGVLIGSATSGSVPSAGTFDILNFENATAGTEKFYGKVKEVKVFRRALTDAELTELTNNIV